MAEITIGVLASVAAAVVTTPLEGLRMKLVSMEKVPKNSDMKSRQDNGHHDLKRLVLGRSLRSLSTEIMPGLPILSYYAVSSGIRLGFFGSMQNRGFLTQNLNERRYFIRSIVVASVGALFGGFVAHPLFVIRAHLQHPQRFPVRCAISHVYRYRGHPVLGAISDVRRDFGLTGFFRGYLTAMPIIVSGPVAQLITFTYVKEWLADHKRFGNNSWYIPTLAALASHFVVATMTNPIESALNRLHHQKPRGYRSYCSSMKAIVQSDGIRGYYNGAVLGLLRIVPHQLLTLVIWDILRTQFQTRQIKNN